MKTKKIRVRQGFTIVELVIVIGVIGVLTAVLVPTFINLNKKAQVASNQSFVKNLNTQMAIREQEEGKNATMHDAILDAREIGFDVEKITPVDNRDIVWDSVSNRFLLLEQDGTVFFGQEDKKATKDEQLWKVYDKMPSTQKYSIYAKTGWNSEPVTGLTTGFDAGSNENIPSVEYASDSDKNVVVRTNGGTFKVNAKNGNVAHFGYAESVNVVDVASSSYHENGSVRFMEVAGGHVVLENASDVNAVHFVATSGSFKNAEGKNISIDISKAGNKDIAFSRDAVTIGPNGTYVAEVKDASAEYVWLFGNGIKEQMVVSKNSDPIAENGNLKPGITAGAKEGSVAEQIANPAKRNEQGQLIDNEGTVVTPENAVVEPIASKEDVQVGATLFAGGAGTEYNPYIVMDYETMTNISKLCVYDEETGKYNGYHYFKVKDGVKEIDCFGSELSVRLGGSFDGNGVVFNNLNSNVFGRVIGETGVLGEGSAYIKNFTVNFGSMNYGGVLNWNTVKNLEMRDITVHGYIENSYNMASFIDYGGKHNDNETHVKLIGCNSDATIVYTQGSACGMIGHPYSNAASTFEIEGCSYTGQMYSSSGKGNEITSFGVNGTVTRDGSAVIPNKVVYDSSKLHKITTENGTVPAKYDVFSTSIVTGCDHATAILTIGPNGNGTTLTGGYYCGDYMTEDDLLIADGKISTKNIKYFDVTSNGTATATTGLSNDGKVFNIVNSNYNNVIGGASVRIIQYDALGNILKITTWDITPE